MLSFLKDGEQAPLGLLQYFQNLVERCAGEVLNVGHVLCVCEALGNLSVTDTYCDQRDALLVGKLLQIFHVRLVVAIRIGQQKQNLAWLFAYSQVLKRKGDGRVVRR